MRNADHCLGQTQHMVELS